jgi:hypothetical protein
MKLVQKVSSHSEYLKNRSSGLNVTWQPIGGDLTTHPWTVTLLWGYQVGSDTPLTEFVYSVTITFTNLLILYSNFTFGYIQKSQGAKSGMKTTFSLSQT